MIEQNPANAHPFHPYAYNTVQYISELHDPVLFLRCRAPELIPQFVHVVIQEPLAISATGCCQLIISIPYHVEVCSGGGKAHHLYLCHPSLLGLCHAEAHGLSCVHGAHHGGRLGRRGDVLSARSREMAVLEDILCTRLESEQIEGLNG